MCVYMHTHNYDNFMAVTYSLIHVENKFPLRITTKHSQGCSQVNVGG